MTATSTDSVPALGPPATDRRATTSTFLLLLAASWPTLASFPGTWAQSYQEHGFFVAAMVAWLLVRDRGKLGAAAGAAPGGWSPVLVMLSLAWMAAVVMNVRLVHQGLFVVLLTSWGLAALRRDARQVVLGIGLTALLAVPFWGVAVPVLQRATVLASGGGTRLLGISAEIGRDYVAISSGTFLIEEGCAGLNYLMGGLVLGAAYGHLFAKRWQTQLRIVALFGAMAIVGNWIRVAALIVLGEVTAMQSPYIQNHLWQGWLVFSLLMIPTFALARRIELRNDGRAQPAPSESAAVSASDGPAAVGPSAAPVTIRRLPYSARAGAFAALGPGLFTVLSLIPRGTEIDSDVSSIGVSPSWTAEARPAGSGWSPAFQGVDAVRGWGLLAGDTQVEVARHYFIDQRQGEELVQFDNRIAPDSAVVGRRLFGPVGNPSRFVNETVIIDGGVGRLVWHWYRVAGVDTWSGARAKLLEIPSFIIRHPAAELVTLTATCAPNDCTAAASALAAALGNAG